MTRFFIALIVGVAWIAPEASAIEFQAGMNPSFIGGSFSRSCIECRVYLNGLFCQCKGAPAEGEVAAYHFTRLNLALCDNSASIQNKKGALVCDPIVRGSWVNSCSNRIAFEDRIGGTCKTESGSFNPTSFSMFGCPSLKFENKNGNLQCMK